MTMIGLDMKVGNENNQRMMIELGIKGNIIGLLLDPFLPTHA